jgi:carbon storage regulator
VLVLTRKRGEAIVMGDEPVVIRVLEVSGDAVRIGIDAPRSVSVLREEIWLATAANQAAAAAPAPDALPQLAPAPRRPVRSGPES